MLVKVLPLKYNRIAWFYLCGYGVPALIVGVSSAVYSEGYGTSTCCWLTHDHGFIWTFTGPVLLVMVINICFLIQTLRVIYKVGHGTMRSSHQDTHLQCFRRAARGAVLLQCILGTTWIIGYAYQGPSTLVFAYVFTTLNSTQVKYAIASVVRPNRAKFTNANLEHKTIKFTPLTRPKGLIAVKRRMPNIFFNCFFLCSK
ncbi:adhesion G protein-coupled receptor L3-like [Lineus longissimus]|uniref:adhesion G protein-coupled receptor L3-like n=1 Tax=Lineus longissimus TaxID=88925 RepID=UPI00315D6258